MKNFAIAKKLIISFLLMAVMSLLIGGISIVSLKILNNADKSLYDGNLLAITYIDGISLNVSTQRVHFRNVVIYESDSSTFKDSIDALNTLDSELSSLISKYEGTITLAEDRDAFDAFKNVYYGDFKTFKEKAIECGKVNDTVGARDALNSASQATSVMMRNVEKSVELNKNQADNAIKNNNSTFLLILFVVIALIAASIVIAFFFASYITKMIARPIKRMRDFIDIATKSGRMKFTQTERSELLSFASADEVGQSIRAFNSLLERLMTVSEKLESIADGDLRVHLDSISSEDTIGNAVNKMVDNLNNMFSQINEASEQVNSGADQVSGASQALSQGATEQASSIEELSASIMDISDQVNANSQNASKASDIAQETSSEVNTGNQQMRQMLSAMDDINASSSEISKIIKVIDDIAFQTNILALNAAVEAARAGAAGKGFAVVADEVRNLASKSADAAKQTTTLIEGSVSSVNNGVQIANKTAESLEIVAKKTDEVGSLVANIARASHDQAEAISQINVGVSQISSVVQNNSATAEESAAASEELAGQANMLGELISQFKLK